MKRYGKKKHDNFRTYKGFVIAVIDDEYVPSGCIFKIDDNNNILSYWRKTNTPLDFNCVTYSGIRKQIDSGVIEQICCFSKYDDFKAYIEHEFDNVCETIEFPSKHVMYSIFE